MPAIMGICAKLSRLHLKLVVEVTLPPKLYPNYGESGKITDRLLLLTLDIVQMSFGRAKGGLRVRGVILLWKCEYYFTNF